MGIAPIGIHGGAGAAAAVEQFAASVFAWRGWSSLRDVLFSHRVELHNLQVTIAPDACTTKQAIIPTMLSQCPRPRPCAPCSVHPRRWQHTAAHCGRPHAHPWSCAGCHSHGMPGPYNRPAEPPAAVGRPCAPTTAVAGLTTSTLPTASSRPCPTCFPCSTACATVCFVVMMLQVVWWHYNPHRAVCVYAVSRVYCGAASL